MDWYAGRARRNPEPALREWRDRLLDQQRRDAAEIQAKGLKIQARRLELAHHRRIRFGNRSEAFLPDQRDLFQGTWDTDLGAIEAEVEQLAETTTTRADQPKRLRAGRSPLPGHRPRWRGHRMFDDFAGYKGLFAEGVTEPGCFAHARRKFFDLHAAQVNPIALEHRWAGWTLTKRLIQGRVFQGLLDMG